MGRRSRGDPIDLICYEWGEQRRKVVGLDEPRKAAEYLGAVRCTLGARRDLHHGGTSGRIEQHFPEVYTGEALFVAQAFHYMNPELKRIMEVHYVAHAPAIDKAEFLCMSVRKYWEWVGYVRSFVRGWLAKTEAA